MNTHNKQKTATSESKLSCKPCEKKSHTHLKAVQEAKNYNQRVAMQIGSMNPYHCLKSKVWHIGHKDQRNAIRAVKRHMWGKSCFDGVEQWEI